MFNFKNKEKREVLLVKLNHILLKEGDNELDLTPRRMNIAKEEIEERKLNIEIEKLRAMNRQKIEVGTVTNYSVKGGFNAFGLSNVLDTGSGRGVPGWNYNQKAFEQFKPMAARYFKEGVAKIINGSFSVEAMTNKIGTEASTKYKAMIERIKSPANSPATSKKKGFNNPMIETGHFKSNIAAKINGGRIVGRGGG